MGVVTPADPLEACSQLNSIHVRDDEVSPTAASSPIVLVKYGNCFPITKIKYA